MLLLQVLIQRAFLQGEPEAEEAGRFFGTRAEGLLWTPGPHESHDEALVAF